MTEAKSEQLLHNLNLLLEINSSLNRAVGLDEVLQNIIRGLVDIFGYNGSLIFEYANDKEPLLTLKAHAYNCDTGILKKVEKLLGFSVLGHEFKPEEDQIFQRLYIKHLPVVASFNEIKDDDLKLIRIFADQVAVALENSRLFTEERRQRQVNETLREIAQAVGSSLDPDDVLHMILEELKKVIDYQGGAILLIDEKERLIYTRILEGYGKDAELFTLPLDSDKGITVEVARTGEPLYIPDVSQDERFISFDRTQGSEMTVPLKIKERVIGVLNVETDKIDAYSEEDLRLLMTFASQSAVALENTRYYENIRQSEERFSHIAENIGDWVWEIDQEGCYTYCNSVVTRILGYSPEEMMGKPLYDFAIEAEYEKMKNWRVERERDLLFLFFSLVQRRTCRRARKRKNAFRREMKPSWWLMMRRYCARLSGVC